LNKADNVEGQLGGIGVLTNPTYFW